MQLYMNLTSPFARLARVAIAEKGLADAVRTIVVDPWADPAEFLDANPAARVPVLLTDDGVALSESGLILAHLDHVAPEPRVLAGDRAASLARGGLAMGAIEAAVSVIIGRKSSSDFDAQSVGRRRFRTMRDCLARLEGDPPPDFSRRVDIAGIATAVAVDYILFRFSADRDWLEPCPRLKAWRERQEGRASLVETMPRDMRA